jgi:hypothetical protein
MLQYVFDTMNREVRLDVHFLLDQVLVLLLRLCTYPQGELRLVPFRILFLHPHVFLSFKKV